METKPSGDALLTVLFCIEYAMNELISLRFLQFCI